jgi:uncharacterized protein
VDAILRMKKLLVLLAFLSASVSSSAEEMPRLVSVTGEAEVMTVPDEVHMTLQVENFDEKLAKAKAANDEAIKNVLALVKKFAIDPKDFKTDFFTVRNEERYYFDQATQQQRSKKGFFVTKNVSIVLRDVAKFEALYSAALEGGVNNIYGVEFKSSRMKELRVVARTQAAQAAKEKAAKLASDMGASISRVWSISEYSQPEWPRPMPMMVHKMAMDSASSAPASNETIALGQIKITYSVSASFELK